MSRPPVSLAALVIGAFDGSFDALFRAQVKSVLLKNMTSLTGCARPVKIDKFFTALLGEIKLKNQNVSSLYVKM